MVDPSDPVSNPDGAVADEFAPDPRNVRLLKWAIYIMSAMLVIGVIVVAVTIAKRSANLSSTGKAGFGDLEVAMPAGTVISKMSIDGDRMAVHLKPADGGPEEVVIVNIRRGRIEGRVKFTPQP